MNKYLATLGRILLAQIFLVAIIIQIMIILKNPAGYDEFQIYLGQHGLVGVVAPLMILIQLVGGACLFIGYKTRLVAYILGVYALFIAFSLHLNEPIILMQYLAIVGGLLTLAANPKTALSVDNLID